LNEYANVQRSSAATPFALASQAYGESEISMLSNSLIEFDRFLCAVQLAA
jgi:hypothetical protein